MGAVGAKLRPTGIGYIVHVLPSLTPTRNAYKSFCDSLRCFGTSPMFGGPLLPTARRQLSITTSHYHSASRIPLPSVNKGRLPGSEVRTLSIPSTSTLARAPGPMMQLRRSWPIPTPGPGAVGRAGHDLKVVHEHGAACRMHVFSPPLVALVGKP